MRQLPDDNLKYPVLVKTETLLLGSGTFIALEKKLYFATAKHVLFNLTNMALSTQKIILQYYPLENEDPSELELDLEKIYLNGKLLYHKNGDVAVIEIANIIPDSREGKSYKFNFIPEINVKSFSGTLVSINRDILKTFDEVLVSNDIFLLGYPSSLTKTNQIDYESPLLRKGIVAGKNKKTKSIIIDSAVYKGNSGGPVFEINRNTDGSNQIRLIGLAIQFVPFVETTINKDYGYENTRWENSGYSIVVPVDFIIELIDEQSK